jgi:poly(A) polymerase
MASVLPEVQAMVGFGEGIRHKDVWEHTKKVVLQSPRRLNVRWAALLHDIGKVPTRRFEPGGQVTFIGHPVVGARMFSKIALRLPFENVERNVVRFLIAEHLRASAFDETWTDAAVRRFTKDIGAHLDDLLDLSRADITSKYADKVRRGIALIDTLEQRVRELRELDAKPAPLPKGLGTALIDHFNLTPGPGLGTLIKQLKSEVEAGRLGVQESFDHYIRYVERHPTLMSDLK